MVSFNEKHHFFLFAKRPLHNVRLICKVARSQDFFPVLKKKKKKFPNSEE